MDRIPRASDRTSTSLLDWKPYGRGLHDEPFIVFLIFDRLLLELPLSEHEISLAIRPRKTRYGAASMGNSLLVFVEPNELSVQVLDMTFVSARWTGFFGGG